MGKKILIGLGVVFLVLAAAAAIALFVYPKARISSATHLPAPDFTLTDATGTPFTLSAQRGHKVVLYFFRGYW